MRKLIIGNVLVGVMILFATSFAFAIKPGEETNPNGFPTGDHYNLNIHGKKMGFNCPEPYSGPDYNGEIHQGEYGDYILVGTDADGNPIYEWKYDNSIFIPEMDAKKEIKILMESGKQGGRGNKNTSLADVLKVTDPCSADFDNDAATIQLPPNENGYNVYVRALAKPTDDPSVTIENVGLNYVEDGDGNILYFAGSLGEGWVDSETDNTFTRTKGKTVATDITKLFEFTGDVCYLYEEDCQGDAENSCEKNLLCCADIDGDGLTDVCEPRQDTDNSGSVDEFDMCDDKDLDGDGVNEDFTEMTAFCRHYDNEWVFNIADFAQYFWDLDNNGMKLLQIRFYPKN
jgi:hypothetical protein